MDGPHQGSRPVHKMDGPNQVKLIQIHKVDRLQLDGRTQQGSNLFQMNGSDEGSKSHSVGLMDTTKIKNLLQVYKVDGHR